MGAQGKGRRQHAKTPLTIEQLEGMIAHLLHVAELAPAGVADFARYRAIRDAVILAFGFFGFLRQSEIVAMDVSAVSPALDHIHLYLPWTKTDQDWMGSDADIPASIIGIVIIDLWRRHTANMQQIFGSQWSGDAPAFPRLRMRDCSNAPMRLASDGAISTILKDAMTGMYAAVDAGDIRVVPRPPPGASYASHSLRRGADTHAEKNGATEEHRCVLGRWVDASRSQHGYVGWNTAGRKAAICRAAFNTRPA
jgi:integrase